MRGRFWGFAGLIVDRQNMLPRKLKYNTANKTPRSGIDLERFHLPVTDFCIQCLVVAHHDRVTIAKGGTGLIPMPAAHDSDCRPPR